MTDQSAGAVAVIIPVLNEAEALPKVLGSIPDWVGHVIVADNGSSDGSADIARAHGAIVVSEPRRGYGSACLKALAALPEDVGIVVFMDGDASDDSGQMTALVDARDDAQLGEHLRAIASAVADMTVAILRVTESCDPHIFYHHVRPYITSWPADGVVYEGTSVGPVTYSGGSAAQSSLLQSIDAALGIEHAHVLTRDFLQSMRAYMPAPHRRFIEDVERHTRIRARVMRSDAAPSLRADYDAAVGAIDELRRKHMGVVNAYITQQMPAGASAVGTGGTSFNDFLRQARVETVQAKTIGTS